ncbi:MAG: rod shape-determining protein MreC [Planctomycetota bacterium]
MNFQGNVTKPRVLIALMVAAMACSLLGRHAAAPLRRAVGYALAPVGDAGMYLSTALKSELKAIGSDGLTAEEARELRSRYESLQRQLLSLASENARLHHFLRTSDDISKMYAPTSDVLARRLIPARVVLSDSLPYGKTRLVNVGKSTGASPNSWVTSRLVHTNRTKALQKGLATITPQALVGRTTDETGAFTARVRLVTDPAFSMAAHIRRLADGRTVIVDQEGSAVEDRLTEDNNKPIPVWIQGDGGEMMIARNVTAYHNVKPGDWVMTTGEDHMLPIRIAVGRVESVEPDPEDPQVVTVRIKPFEDLSTLRDVHIIAPPPSGRGSS